MILLDRPFASDFLVQTLKNNRYPVVSTPEARALVPDEGLYWISEEEAIRQIRQNSDLPVYSNSENALSWIERHFADTSLANNIRLFKDKAAFRQLTSDLFPDLYFRTVGLQELSSLTLEGIPFPFVIKPSVGFFSLDVHVVNDHSDWERVRETLKRSLAQKLFPKSVLDTSTFIIEAYIEGEEYAVDCYYDDQGEPVILNILHHHFSSGSDTSDRVYSSSLDVILSLKKPLKHFLRSVGQKMGLKNFPLHVEVRLDSKGVLRPIEVNPLRYGGWCTTGDMAWFAYGVNSYEYFFQRKAPDWKKIFQGKEDKIFSIVVLNNNSGYEAEEIECFNYRKLEADFEQVLATRKLSIEEYPLFGFLFIETSPDRVSELEGILVSDLRTYIELK